jgi:DNA-binding NarL/FixJ family response regulator
MAEPRILFLQCPSDRGNDLPDSLRRRFPDVTADLCRTVTQALDSSKLKGCQAVVCWAETPDELAAVIRIRKADPKLPILLVSDRDRDKEFSSLALQMGATSVLPDSNDDEDLAEAIAVTLRTVALSGEARHLARRSHELSKEIGKLAQKTKELAGTALDEVTASRGRFAPLIIVANKKEAGRVKKALTRAQLISRLPILSRGEEAVAYLEGRARYQDRARYPLPSLVILDLELAELSGFETLSWIRKEPHFKSLPVAVLSPSMDEAHRAKAAALGATWCFPKGATPSDLAETLKKISLNWTVHSIGLDL